MSPGDGAVYQLRWWVGVEGFSACCEGGRGRPRCRQGGILTREAGATRWAGTTREAGARNRLIRTRHRRRIAHTCRGCRPRLYPALPQGAGIRAGRAAGAPLRPLRPGSASMIWARGCVSSELTTSTNQGSAGVRPGAFGAVPRSAPAPRANKVTLPCRCWPSPCPSWGPAHRQGRAVSECATGRKCPDLRENRPGHRGGGGNRTRVL